MRIATVGDVGVDVYENLGLLYPGGIGLNFALSLQELGVEDVFLYHCLGDDRRGDFVAAALEGAGLHLRGRRRPGACSTQYIDVDAGGNRRFTGYYPNVLDGWRLTADEREELLTMDAIAAPASDGLRAVLEDVLPLDFGGVLAIDFSEDGEWWGREYFDRFTPKLQIAFFGVHRDVPPDIPELASRHPEKTFVVTMGPAGSVGFRGDAVVSQPALVSSVVDTTGCGDAFQAGFLAAWLHKQDLGDALRAGARQAAVHMSHHGANRLRPTLRVPAGERQALYGCLEEG